MSWLSLLPPLVAILIALWRREVILALLAAILLAELILAGGRATVSLPARHRTHRGCQHQRR